MPLKSRYSFRFGVESPESLAEGLFRSGFSGGVLCDTGNAAGQMEFAGSAGRRGVTGGAGAELEIDGCRFFFVSRGEGWRELCAAVTATRLPERVTLREALSGANNLTAVAAEPAAAGVLRKKGFAGEIMTAVLPECISGVHPARAEKELIHGGRVPVACWPVVFRHSRGIKVHRILREGYLNIEKKRPAESEFASPFSVMPGAEAFGKAF